MVPPFYKVAWLIKLYCKNLFSILCHKCKLQQVNLTSYVQNSFIWLLSFIYNTIN